MFQRQKNLKNFMNSKKTTVNLRKPFCVMSYKKREQIDTKSSIKYKILQVVSKWVRKIHHFLNKNYKNMQN